MSKSTFGWRQAGFTAVATALVFGGTLVGAGAASAAIVNPAFVVITTPAGVIQGTTNQAASNVDYRFDNAFAVGDTIAFQIKPNNAANNCAAGATAAVGFSALPTVTGTKLTGSNANTAAPTFTSALSSSGVCTAAGIQDILTITLTSAAVVGTPATDRVNAAITNIKYIVGATAPLGNVNFAVGATSVVNAVVVDRDFSFIPREAATPGSLNNALGTATYTETTAGAFFKAGQTSTVTLALDGNAANKFTAGVTPTINAPAGYTVTKAATTSPATNNYSFTVAAPATAVKAVVTVAGLRANVGPDVEVSNLDSTVTSGAFTAADPNVKALNIVDFGNSNRVGGDTRYDTAAALFNKVTGGTNPVAVLSGGEQFPDALSANYLAKAFGTGTLLTKSKTLSVAARNAIIDNDVKKVYITGQTDAVSKAIQDQIETMHVGGNPGTAALITTVRLGGDDRYDTNKLINSFAETRQPAGSNTDTVLLSSGENFPDAVAFGAIAYGNSYPLVLTKGASLSDQASSQLAAFDPNDVVISGQTDAVSASAATSAGAAGTAAVSRLGGVDRNATATLIATWATAGLPDSEAPVGSILRGDQGFSSTKVNFTWTQAPLNQGFGDALAAGPLAGTEGSVILLASTPTTPGSAVTDYLGLKTVNNTTGNGTNVGTIRPLGGTDVTSTTLIRASAASIQK